MKVQFKKNEYIFKQDDPGDCAYLVESGRVQILARKESTEIPISIVGESEIFGEMALLDNMQRSATARAAEDCVLVVVSKDQLLDRVHSSDIVVRLLVQMMIKRLRHHIDDNVAIGTMGQSLEQTEGLNQIKLEGKIYDAFKNNEFLLYHQPIIDLETRSIMGSESLIRWKSPTEGMISPALFIDLIENSSIIVPVGQWIIEESLKTLAGIQKDHPRYTMSINISGRQLVHHNFLNHLTETAQKFNISPETVKLEMTERVLMDGVIVVSTLEKCRDKGFKISIDDFGTGYSSLQYLAQLPIDIIKIDGSFVKKMMTDSRTEAVVKSIFFLAQSLGMKTISEGIETEEQLNKLIELGSDYGQGYYFSKPLPIDELTIVS